MVRHQRGVAARFAEDGQALVNEPPRVLISALRVSGVSQHVSELGDSEPPALILSPDQNQLEIEFFELNFHAGERQVTVPSRWASCDWSPPTELHRVNYGRLAVRLAPLPGQIHLPDGLQHGAPAAVRFTILPPIYARWWFVSLAVLFTGAAGFALYRVRVAQLLRVERIRARIAI